MTGAPEEARWVCPAPRRTWAAGLIERVAEGALGRRVAGIEPLAEGLRNANFKLHFDAREPVVLRLYEHDASLCQKEVDLIRLVGASVPVPEVIYAAPRASEDLPPFALMRWVDGVSFRDLKRTGDLAAIAQAAWSVGEALAAIGRFGFEKPGWLGPGPAVGAPLLEGTDAMPRFLDLCLESALLQQRMPEDLRTHTHDLVWSAATRLAEVANEWRLVHGDFNRRNVLVRESAGRWQVAAVLDWEFAVSGSPLMDIANFLRYERADRPLAAPYFSAGYGAGGGKLPEDWLHLARLVDLTALCESLTHSDLPDGAAEELVELVRRASAHATALAPTPGAEHLPPR